MSRSFISGWVDRTTRRRPSALKTIAEQLTVEQIEARFDMLDRLFEAEERLSAGEEENELPGELREALAQLEDHPWTQRARRNS